MTRVSGGSATTLEGVARCAVWCAVLCFTLLVTAIWPAPRPVSGRAEPAVVSIMKTKACGSCHLIPGVPGAFGTLGPSLKGFGKRPRIAGNKLTNNEANLRKWLQNPKKIKPDSMMPALGLSDDELTLLVQFLQTL